MSLNVEKSILITGASSGIGEALAVAYAQLGTVLFLCGRNEERLSGVAEECRRKGAIVYDAIIDVTDKGALEKWILTADDRHALDLVIANAGISGGTGGRQKGEDLEAAEKVWDINLMGKIHTVHAILPRMIERGRGQIAMLASLAGFSGWPGAPSYSASKGAVRLYGEGLRGAMMPYGVKINVICPGFVRSRMTDANPYKMPFFMETDKAAKLIVKGLARNKGRIAFPWQTYMLAGFIGLLPQSWSEKLLVKLPQKPAQ